MQSARSSLKNVTKQIRKLLGEQWFLNPTRQMVLNKLVQILEER